MSNCKIDQSSVLEDPQCEFNRTSYQEDFYLEI